MYRVGGLAARRSGCAPHATSGAERVRRPASRTARGGSQRRHQCAGHTRPERPLTRLGCWLLEVEQGATKEGRVAAENDSKKKGPTMTVKSVAVTRCTDHTPAHDRTPSPNEGAGGRHSAFVLESMTPCLRQSRVAVPGRGRLSSRLRRQWHVRAAVFTWPRRALALDPDLRSPSRATPLLPDS